MNFIIGLVLVFGIAVVWGLPNQHPPTTAVVGQTAVSHRRSPRASPATALGPRPGAMAGLKPGDTIVKVGDTDVTNFEEMAAAVRSSTVRPRSWSSATAADVTTVVNVTQVQRWLKDADAIGDRPSVRSASRREPPGPTQYNPLTAVPATFAFTGDLAVELGKSLADPDQDRRAGGRDRRRRA